MSNKMFTPVRGTEAKIAGKVMGFNDGYIYFATDTGKIYMDYTDADGAQHARIPFGGGAGGGGNNSGIYYANQEVADKTNPELAFEIDSIESESLPSVDDLIINEADGCFYRVVRIDVIAAQVIGERLNVSGGGGGGVSTLEEDVDLEVKDLPSINLINNISQLLDFRVESAKDKKGKPVSSKATITWVLSYTEDGGRNYIQHQTDTFQVDVDKWNSIDLGKIAKPSSSQKITITVTQTGTTSTDTWELTFNSSELNIKLPTSFSNLNYVNCDQLKLDCVVSGNMEKRIYYYFDNMEEHFHFVDLGKNEQPSSVLVSNYRDVTYGYHKVAMELVQLVNGEVKTRLPKIEYEVATYTSSDPDQKPIIWLGEYKDVYYNYEMIQIPFRVYDPQKANEVLVHFKKNGKDLDNSPQTITSSKSWSYFEIPDAQLDTDLSYTISCGEEDNRETIRKVDIKIVEDPLRKDFKVHTESLAYSLNTIGSGRSNDESESRRQQLVNNGIAAKFENFNWNNNGWIRDKHTDNKTALRISNGAKLTIPIGKMRFSDAVGNATTDTSHTIEIMFKIRNVQDFSKLLYNITRYKNDEALFREFYDEEKEEYKTTYTNYDTFLAWYLKTHDVPGVDKDNKPIEKMTYDDLIYAGIDKKINLNNVVCGYYSGNSKNAVGLCLGPQDAFFSNGTDKVNVSYVEDRFVTLSLVSQYDPDNASQNLITIYLNGILTGVVKSGKKSGFSIESENMVFDSSHCDIDLYKIRVYNKPLDVNNILMNYAVDFNDINIYDQNNLAIMNDSINEYQFNYDKMIEYNNAHPDAPLMPYIIFDTSNSTMGDKLSYTKDINIKVGVEFVNTYLDYAYSSGQLEALAYKDGLWTDGDTAEVKAEAVKKYYKHHSPSWKGDYVNMAVQGTSSEFYPRRNYKLKAKNEWDDDGKERTHIFLHKGPFANEYDHDMKGVKARPYVLATEYDPEETYYADAEGKQTVVISTSNPFKKNTFYIKNIDWVEFGKEKTRQKYWYMDNYVAGTTKWTMKIDFMESSGSYNMGFANLVANAYSKHPLKDYNDNNVFCTKIDGTATEATTYDPNATYCYLSHKGAWKTAGADNEEGIIINSAEDFAKGPAGFGTIKVLGGTKKDAVNDLTDIETINKNIADTVEENEDLATYEKGFNKWFILTEATYPDFMMEDLDSYRTSVQGFRTLTFHKKSDGSMQFIGMYNMLLDKGSDEVYGFKPDKTTGATPLQKFLDNQEVSDITECWEFSNNQRTYCSFRDPDNRKDLSFDCYGGGTTRKLNSVGSAPVVCDSFEYRYHRADDALDYIYNPVKEMDKKADAIKMFPKHDIDNLDDRAEIVFDQYKNWERAVAWVWSTCTEVVESKGTYNPVEIYKQYWSPKKFYLYDAVEGKYKLDEGEAYDATLTYFEKDIEGTYVNAGVCPIGTDASKIFSGNNKLNFYTKVKDTYVPCTLKDEFDNSTTYYELIEDIESLAQKCDRLVKICSDEAFDPEKVYYNYDGSQMNGKAVTIADVTADNYEPDKYYEGTEIIYGTHSHLYDTKEYRADKFIYELADHFDIEYMATYFVMTEVFECYDSRGKNAMFASWGPQKEGGDYIWYPIFYDIDTQLGVNNTGIPSFEYNVDATEDGNYSTSDSVLWNNFYAYFKTSDIIAKYRHLKGITAGVPWSPLKKNPLQSPEYIEQWYNTDYEVTGSLAHKGIRPMVAKNLDQYYKYITITNRGLNDEYKTGICGHISGDDKGEYTYDSECGYFYMLQGDRSLSRYQFLKNRLEYIDSWLNQGNYKRGGANRIRGRVAANNPINTSDLWVETTDSPYYLDAAYGEQGSQKRHKFDAEYWLTITPSHSSYVTLGDDAEAYPSRKYDGIHPLRFNIDAIEKGVRQSANYPEQLLYIYGMNQIQDLGDMSNLYWQEFEISGNASQLTSLKLGYDGVVVEDGVTYTWKNNKMNFPIIPASKESEYGMPLLKEVNLCNLQINEGGETLDFTSCEKLENFRATGSNFKEFYFADGVALNTLYLPKTLTGLSLNKPKLLKKLITEYSYPKPNEEGKLVANEGLYLEGFFDGDQTTNIADLTIKDSGLGYDSYKLLKQYYDIRKNQGNPSNITMTDVVWSPYTIVGKEDEYVESNSYYYDDGHYGLKEYEYDIDTWATKVVNQELYVLNTKITNDQINLITNVDMLKTFADETSAKFRESEGHNIPKITGIIYINNPASTLTGDTANDYDEFTVRETLQKAYPDVTFFFANIKKAYTAKFLVMDADEGENGTYTIVAQQSIREGWFNRPEDLTVQIKKVKPNNDFEGWALTNKLDAEIIYSSTIDKWDSIKVNVEDTPTKTDYYFYAICPIHKWTVKFFSEGVQVGADMLVPHMTSITGPRTAPWKDDSALDTDPNYGPSYTYKILGYSASATSNKLVDFSKILITEDTKFYTVWDENPVSVYDNIHPEYFVAVETGKKYSERNYPEYNIEDGVVLGLRAEVKGKITIPATFEGKPVIAIDPSFGAALNDNTLFTSINSTAVWSGDRYGRNITHVFFQKADNGLTNVRQIADLAFYRSPNLKYIEFANGIRTIGQGAFLFQASGSVAPSRLTSSAIGGTIINIGINAFRRAFDSTVNSIEIGSRVQSIGQNAFERYNGHQIRNITIGSPDDPSDLELKNGDNYVPTFTFSSTDNVNVQFYTTNTDYITDNSYITKNFKGIENVEMPLLS